MSILRIFQGNDELRAALPGTPGAGFFSLGRVKRGKCYRSVRHHFLQDMVF